MTTPNEELIAELQQLANEIEISYRIESIEEAVKALQSQEERIAELERESETHAKAYGLAIVERDNLRHELKTAQEVGDVRVIQRAVSMPKIQVRITAVHDEECEADYVEEPYVKAAP